MQSPFPQEVYRRNAEIYKIMAHPRRLEILNLLAKGPLSVMEITEVLNARQANVSQHLALLRSNRLVTTARKGLNVVYSIVDPRIVEPCSILRELHRQ